MQRTENDKNASTYEVSLLLLAEVILSFSTNCDFFPTPFCPEDEAVCFLIVLHFAGRLSSALLADTLVDFFPGAFFRDAFFSGSVSLGASTPGITWRTAIIQQQLTISQLGCI